MKRDEPFIIPKRVPRSCKDFSFSFVAWPKVLFVFEIRKQKTIFFNFFYIFFLFFFLKILYFILFLPGPAKQKIPNSKFLNEHIASIMLSSSKFSYVIFKLIFFIFFLFKISKLIFTFWIYWFYFINVF